MKATYLGIDLGTTNSVLTHWDADTKQVAVIPMKDGSEVVPSYVWFDAKSDKVLVGKEAKNKMLMPAELKQVLYAAKRGIGEKYDKKMWKPYKFETTMDQDNNVVFKVKYNNQDVLMTPEKVGFYILSHFKERAEEYLKEKGYDTTTL